MTDGTRILHGSVGPLAGRMPVPSSKSLTNRALIVAAAARGGMILDALDCGDTRILAEALSTAGWAVDWSGTTITIGSRRRLDSVVRLDLGDSGTGARAILALLATTPGHFIVDGSDRLRRRPMEPLVRALRSLGARIEAAGGWQLPVSVEGAPLAGGEIEIRPGVSSQFVTALLMAAPLFRRGLILHVEGPIPSVPYLDLTKRMLQDFGAEVESSADRRLWSVRPGGLTPTRRKIEGDWSAAAFPIAAAGVAGGWVQVPGLDRESAQGDRLVCDILADAGMTFEWFGDRLVARGPVNRPIIADLGATPDTFPALAAVAAARARGSRLTGLEHLIHKESSRLEAMTDNLRRLGATLTMDRGSFEVESVITKTEGAPRPVQSVGDHRIAMAMAVIALEAGPLELDEPDVVAKSFPGFWNLWERLVEGETEGG